MFIEAMKQALEALEAISTEFVCQSAHHAKKEQHSYFEPCPHVTKHDKAITSLRQAIAGAEKQEALQKLHDENERLGLYQGVYEQEPVRLQCTTCGTVYADGVPPQRQPLTDEQIDELNCLNVMWDDGQSAEIVNSREFARAIEAAHGIKGEA